MIGNGFFASVHGSTEIICLLFDLSIPRDWVASYDIRNIQDNSYLEN